MEYIKSIDFISKDINLMIDGKTKFKTLSGGLFTILVSILSISTIIVFGSQIIYKDNPNVTTSNQFLKDGGYINLTNFPIMINLVGRGGVVTKNFESYYNISIVEYKLFADEQNKNQRIVSYLKTEICNEKNFPNSEISESFLRSTFSKNFSEYFCLGKLNKSLEIYGTIGSTNFSYVGVMVQKCVNGSDIICKSEDDINKFFSKNLFVDIRLIDYSFEPENYENVGNIYPKITTIPLSNGIYKRIYIYYKMIDYFTDRGSLFKTMNKEIFFKYVNYDQNLYFNPAEIAFDKQTVNEITITVGNIKEINYRTYYKLQNLAADVGGIIKVLMIFFNFINNYLSSKMFIHSLYENLFIKYSKENNLEIKKEFFNKNEINSSHSDKIINNFTTIKSIHKFGNIEEEKFELIDAFCFFRKEKKTREAISRKENLIKKMLDLKYLIENINIIEVIRYILFSKTKNELINVARMNPNIYLINRKIMNENLLDKSKLEMTLNNLNNNDDNDLIQKKNQMTRLGELLEIKI